MKKYILEAAYKFYINWQLQHGGHSIPEAWRLAGVIVQAYQISWKELQQYIHINDENQNYDRQTA